MNDQDLLAAYIHQFALADHMSQDLLRCLRLYRFAAQTEIYSQDRDPTVIYFLVAGKIQVNHYHPNGKHLILGNLTPLAVIGDLGLFYDNDLSMTITALEPSILLGIEKGLAVRYGYDDPRFLRLIIRNLAAKLYGSTVVLTRTVLPLIGQVAAYLLDQPTDVDNQIRLESKQYLAGLTGTTVRHLNRVFKSLEAENLIRLSGNRLEILNRTELARYTEL
jgi:CRP-like cAMP-binding protein